MGEQIFSLDKAKGLWHKFFTARITTITKGVVFEEGERKNWNKEDRVTGLFRKKGNIKYKRR
ncbi:MAG TPA: hypothetical protein VK568_06650 [Thermodesulfobacteriota bacterium]|jgi:hypothetical protein|nr:hypothetical protein [Thermodesulfobacteriota bacterium]